MQKIRSACTPLCAPHTPFGYAMLKYSGSPLTAVAAAAVVYASLVPQWGHAAPAAGGAALGDTLQLAPAGYSGAINTPTADVLPHGSAAFALTNSIPERASLAPGVGGFGTLNLGFGLLPGLEVVGRLAFDGDLQCSGFVATCGGKTRDLSVSGKYQFPIALPLNTRLAVGVTDFGGAATNFRQTYGVATATWGPVDVSLGYSRASSKTALMDGVFGSAALRINDQWAVVAEHDTQATRLGTHYTLPVANDLALQLGYSRKLSGPASQQSNQITATLHYFFDRKNQLASRSGQPAWLSGGGAGDKAAGTSARPSRQLPANATADQRAHALADALLADGFAQVEVALRPAAEGKPALWWVRAEPVGWRKNQLEALGVGLASWMTSAPDDNAEVVLTLTHLSQPTVSAHTDRTCLNAFADGQDQCGQGLALNFYRGNALPTRLAAATQGNGLTALVGQKSSLLWKPQIELGVDVRTSVGTEYGLADYSAALDVGMEMALAPGLSWQGSITVPVSNSGDYEPGRPFGAMGHPKTRFEQALLSYWRTVDTPWFSNVAVQGSVGAINASHTGGQVDAVWMNPEGNWRLGGMAGVYHRSSANKTTVPLLGSVRHSVVPGQWHLEATAGKYLRGDVGFGVASVHWFGDYRLKFYVRDSKGDALMPRTRFAGFEFSMPIGPRASTQFEQLSVRGQDRFDWGLATKIGQTNNVITPGYGEVPRARHGVWTDATDYDRNGTLDLWGNRSRLRSTLRTHEPAMLLLEDENAKK